MSILRLFDDSDRPRENDSFGAFFKDILSDTMTSVLVFLIIGIVLVCVVAFYFKVSFVASLGICAFLGLGFLMTKLTGIL